MSTPQERQLADILNRLERDVESLKKGTRPTQLNHSSLEDDSLRSYDSGGFVRQRYGKQKDGRFAITYSNGDQPPAPSVPTAVARELGIVVSWDGTFDSDNPPTDFQRVDVHASETDGFTPDGTTVIGSMHQRGVIGMFMDLTPKFVKLVAVNTSQVASAASDQISVTAQPASEIAANSITGDHLAATFLLASQFVAGNESGRRVVIDPTERLFRVFNADNLEVGYIGAQTGNWTAGGGAYFTDSIGQYVKLEGALAEIGYPSAGERVEIRSDYVALWYNSDSNSIQIGQGSGSLNGIITDLRSGIRGAGVHLQSTNTSLPAVTLQYADGLGNVDTNSQLLLQLSGFDEPHLLTGNKDVSFVFGNNSDLYLVNDTNNTGRRIQASDFVVYSGSESKVNIRDVPYSSLDIVRNTPAKQWERPVENSETYVGVIAEEMPDEITMSSGNTGEPIMSQTTTLGTLWNAIHELSAKVDDLASRVSAMEE